MGLLEEGVAAAVEERPEQSPVRLGFLLGPSPAACSSSSPVCAGKSGAIGSPRISAWTLVRAISASLQFSWLRNSWDWSRVRRTLPFSPAIRRFSWSLR